MFGPCQGQLTPPVTPPVSGNVIFPCAPQGTLLGKKKI